jgi:signal transduction histidine kinase
MEATRIDIATALAVVARIEAIPPLLRLAAELAGGRVALLVEVSDSAWIASAVQDRSHGGAEASGEPACAAPLRVGSATGFDVDSRFHTPVVLASGRKFGLLCALDALSSAPDARLVAMFGHVSEVIAMQLDQLDSRDLEQGVALDERSAGVLREQFIAILGHDLRNPLQAIYMSSDTLTRSDVPRVATIAARIKTNARRMALLIDDVLDFARGRLGGGIDIELTEVVNINGGIATVVQELQTAHPEREIVSSIDVDRPVSCDLGRIQQVVSNLLGNALTHGRTDSPIRVTARVAADDMLVEVWNDGAPIPPGSIERMFEPFWRHSKSASLNGLGLGLYICSQIVRAHHGKISVTSSTGAGTQFTVLLPLVAAAKTQVTLMAAASA